MRKIGLDLRYLSNLEVFQKVSEQLKERRITRSASVCEAWWNRSRLYVKYWGLLGPSQSTSTTTEEYIKASKPDEADAVASPAGNKRSQPESQSDQGPQSPEKVPKRTQTRIVDKALAISTQQEGVLKTNEKSKGVLHHAARLQKQDPGSELDSSGWAGEASEDCGTSTTIVSPP